MQNPLSPESKAILKLMSWSVVIIASLAGLNGLFIMNSVGTQIIVPFTREIASTPAIDYVHEDFVSPVIEFDCKNLVKDLSFTTKAPTTRVLFKGCKSVGRITNVSNKNQGDVFFLPSEDWTSDFIFLNPGKNKLSIPTDSKIHTINIIREKVKSQALKKAL